MSKLSQVQEVVGTCAIKLFLQFISIGFGEDCQHFHASLILYPWLELLSFAQYVVELNLDKTLWH